MKPRAVNWRRQRRQPYGCAPVLFRHPLLHPTSQCAHQPDARTGPGGERLIEGSAGWQTKPPAPVQTRPPAHPPETPLLPSNPAGAYSRSGGGKPAQPETCLSPRQRGLRLPAPDSAPHEGVVAFCGEAGAAASHGWRRKRRWLPVVVPLGDWLSSSAVESGDKTPGVDVLDRKRSLGKVQSRSMAARKLAGARWRMRPPSRL